MIWRWYFSFPSCTIMKHPKSLESEKATTATAISLQHVFSWRGLAAAGWFIIGEIVFFSLRSKTVHTGLLLSASAPVMLVNQWRRSHGVDFCSLQPHKDYQPRPKRKNKQKRLRNISFCEQDFCWSGNHKACIQWLLWGLQKTGCW